MFLKSMYIDPLNDEIVVSNFPPAEAEAFSHNVLIVQLLVPTQNDLGIIYRVA